MTLPGRAEGRVLAAAAGTLLLILIPHPIPATLGSLGLVLLLPGLGWRVGLGSRIRWTSLADWFYTGGVSAAISPLALTLGSGWIPFDRIGVSGTLFASSIAPMVLIPGRWRKVPERGNPGTPLPFYLLLLATLFLLLPTLAIGPTPEGGETFVKGWDLNNHLAISELVASRGLPAQNPFLESSRPFYYHTFFHAITGAMIVLSGPGGSSYLCISILTLLLAGIFLVCFYRIGIGLTGRPRAILFSLPFLSLVGGFDVVPVLTKLFWEQDAHHQGNPVLHFWNIDGWISNQGMLIPTVFASYYWVPHAIAALICFLIAQHLIRHSRPGVGYGVPAGICLVGMAGYNGYIALGGFLTLTLLGLSDLRAAFHGSADGRKFLGRALLAVGAALVVGLPVWRLYLGGRPEVEKFRWILPEPYWPLQVLVEWGPALILGGAALYLLRPRKEYFPSMASFLAMGIWVLPLLALVSSTGENNDLSMRLSLFLWMSLAGLSGLTLEYLFPSGGPCRLRPPGLILGAMSLGMGALSVLWFAYGASVAKPALGPDLVSTGRWIRDHLPPGALVQGSPLGQNPTLVYLSGHPALLSDTWASRLFYADPREFSQRMGLLREVFAEPEPEIACQRLGSLPLAALVVGPEEIADFPTLAEAGRWPCLKTVYSNGRYHVYRRN